MESLELDDDAFYICTEVSPRCFVVQKAIQIDRGQIERMVGDLEKSRHPAIEAPPPPLLPYWFTSECRNNLVNGELPAMSVPAAPSPVPLLPTPDLKQQLKAQLEYYFSRENLITDRYLRCQMDVDQYVPISIIAGFRKIVQLTNDYNLILQVLRESNQVEVDERGEKVRPVCRRCTIILREISEEHAQDVERMLSGGPPYLELKYGLNNSWYVMYDNEETTQKAYLHLQNLDTTFNNKPICARIKAGGPPTAELPPIERAPTQAPDPLQPEPPLFTHMMDLGQLLASYGYVARATYRPGATVVHVEEDERKTNGLSSRTSQPRGRNSFNSGVSNGFYPPSATSPPPIYGGGQLASPAPPIHSDRRNGRGRGQPMNGRRGGDRNMHHGGRRNGGANGSSHYADSRRRPDYWAAGPQVGGAMGGGTSNQVGGATVPTLSVSTGDLTSSAATNQPIERPRYNSFRKPSHHEEVTSHELLTACSRGRRWEEADSDAGSEGHAGDRKSSHSGSVYSFEERAFPSLSQPKPQQPEKPAEKPSFSCVAAGKRHAKPEPKKSYAEKLKEKAMIHNNNNHKM